MPKQKTRQVAKKRFKLTKTGKIKRKAGKSSHKSYAESSNTSYRKRRMMDVTGAFAKKVKKMLGK